MGIFMGRIRNFLIFTMLVMYISNALTPNFNLNSLNRSSFPKDFVFGAASSAYQIEGAASEYGKGPNIWDTFTYKYPEKIRDHSNGNVATDSYHRYKEDVNIVKDMGLDAYRFSISWARLLPSGKISGGINEQGVDYYNNVINELINKGVVPFVTLFHWDLPQTLEDQYGGFLSPQIVNDFVDYSELCFKRYGDRVKNWITFNEPYTYVNGGYVRGEMAPGRCSSWQNLNCTAGDSGVEPYLVAHHQLLSHAAAVMKYKEKYQKSQKGKIGITLVAQWVIPFSKEIIQREAAARALDFSLGWFMEPLARGDYPNSMKSLVKGRLPTFSKEESLMLNGSFDFLGLNYYTTYYARNVAHTNTTNPSYITDSQTQTTPGRNEVLIGPKGASDWLYVYPRGIQEVLLYVKRTYNNPTIYITENGIDEPNNSTLSLDQALVDKMRMDYYFRHLSFVQRTIKKGVDVKGFFAWALMDNFEWSSGYSVRFGLHYVDYNDGLKRYPKLSATWFRIFLQL
ncbi:beta-glucosidase 12-like [Primulina eburnea]|uniref:beta-glucosidase 12-like n=1 Tax=Primulina eburnea TaxID=1245227 RepID=UPI003C6C40F8